MKRRNRTLVEAARTMLTFANLPLFLWAESIATTCFTQYCSIIHKRFDKTPYELMNKRKPNIKFFFVFGCRCYLLNDYDDVGKLKEKGDIEVFVGYSKESASFRIYNKRTLKIHESIMKSSTTNVETSNVEIPLNEEEVFHESSKSFLEESSSPSLNDDVHQRLEEVMTAFLNRILKEEVYVGQHPGFVSTQYPDHVYALDKALYGLKQAPRAWYDVLSQSGMENYDTVSTTMVEKAKLKLDLFGKLVDHTDYRCMIGSLMYVTSSRPDITFATCNGYRQKDKIKAKPDKTEHEMKSVEKSKVNQRQQKVNPVKVKDGAEVDELLNGPTQTHLMGRAPTGGYEDAIVVPVITVDNFELKHGLLTLVQNKQFFGHDKEDPHAHIRQQDHFYLESIPDDLVADFHYMDDAREIWNAVKARFGGNAESKKMRKSMLKQEFSEFRTGDAGEFFSHGCHF
nr:integrase, catalytic region, zinc finger, CCHC-type, peptidase aspartic, catalytic [Tanacetum cinerariifolium]